MLVSGTLRKYMTSITVRRIGVLQRQLSGGSGYWDPNLQYDIQGQPVRSTVTTTRTTTTTTTQGTVPPVNPVPPFPSGRGVVPPSTGVFSSLGVPQDLPPPKVVLKGTKLPVSSQVQVLASIQPPEGIKRTPADICCVIDVSGSMNSPASFMNEQGATESYGLNILDVVKHAVKTIIHSLNPEDRISVVTFTTDAQLLFELSPVTATTKTDLLSQIETLQPLASTNLWGGLEMGMEVLRRGAMPGRLASLFLLTDGLPNVSPPRGELAALKSYKDTNNMHCSVQSFGFGYTIDSKLLDSLSTATNGAYTFVPDSSFVGTVFINALANALTSVADNSSLSVSTVNGASVVPNSVLGTPATYTTWGADVDQSTLHYGQSRDTIFSVNMPQNLQPSTNTVSLAVKYKDWHKEAIVNIVQDGLTVGDISEDLELDYQRNRSLFVDVLGEIIEAADRGNWNKAHGLIEQLIIRIRGSASAKDEDVRAQALIMDLTGQVAIALDPVQYGRWGRHYLPSLRRAHQLQVCNNFKDPGVQHYGGDLFKKTRDEIEKVFVTLPPPTPSTYGYSGSYVSSMSVYHNVRNPCFSGESLMMMSNQSTKKVQDVKKGDIVSTPAESGSTATVLCVVKTRCMNGEADLVTLEGGLKITPYHPFHINGKWQFPCAISAAKLENCPFVYSFVLDSGHVMIINGVECVGLGHNFVDDEVVRHPYFGSQLVIEDLKKLEGWESGLIELEPNPFLRSEETGLLHALDFGKCIVKSGARTA